jgi:branched-chain amino acid transport system ATP-binding protein
VIGDSVILRVDSLVRDFGALRATNNVSFEVRRGEIVGLIGPNGAGKTTITNLVTGALPKTSGSVFLKGEDITGLKPYQIARKGLARTFQVVKPLQGMTVAENVIVGALFGGDGRKRDVASAVARTEDILSLVGLEKKKDFPVNAITLPDLKRMEFARVLAMEPEVVFLDEVMAGLNPAEVSDAGELVKRLRTEKNLTIVYIEHIMKAVMNMSDRIIVLHHGEKISEGTPQEVVSDQRVVEAYLGKRYAGKCGI